MAAAARDPRTGEVVKTRFDHARLQLIFDTNVRQAQAAGQWQRLLRNRRTHPYARYVSMDDDRVRPLHRSWHNVTLPLDDPWWSTHRPPNGYRCRCRVIGVTQRDYDAGEVLERPGAETERDAPLVRSPMRKQAPQDGFVDWRNPASGAIERIPKGIDPGFDYNAGTTGRSQAFDDLVETKLTRLSPEVARAARERRLRTGLPSEEFMGQRPGLMELPPVPVVSLPESALGAGLTHQQLMQQATRLLQLAQRSPGLVNDDTGWLLNVNRKGVKKMGDNQKQSRQALLAVQMLTDLVRHAVVVERHPDLKHGNEFVEAIYRLMVALEIDGGLYRVKLTVKDLNDPLAPRKLLHALESAEIESAPLGTLLTSTGKPALQSTQPTTGRTITIADLLAGAQRHDGAPFTP